MDFVTLFLIKLCFQFRAARKASEEVGAQLVLGDRPIEITVMLTKCFVFELRICGCETNRHSSDNVFSSKGRGIR